MKYVKPFKKYKDPENITINELKEIPLVNFIMPAWNEGEIFRNALLSITKLKYPKIKVIVNAGGSEETIKIADSFKQYDNFKIIYQKKGEGKLKAINDCLPYVTEGILYFVDADIYITDEILIRLLHPLLNLNEKVVMSGHRPLKHQEDKHFVRYLQMNHNFSFRRLYKRYYTGGISGTNACMKYEVIKAIGKFSEKKLYATDISRGYDVLEKGYKIYTLSDYRSLIYSDVADNLRVFVKQRIRWIENSLIYFYIFKKRNLIKFLGLFSASLYLIIFPILSILHLGFFLIGLYILLSFYLKRLRRILFFKKTRPQLLKKLEFIFYVKILFYIYVEAIINVYILIDFIFFRKKFKERRNLL
ncbi:MAG: glycosyltransferase [Candidatus Hodarchaeota archaeon]